MTKYVFRGITPFVREAAEREGLLARYAARPGKAGEQAAAVVGLLIGKAETTWHLKRLADALGQLPEMKEADRPGKIAYVQEVFDSLKLAYLAAEEAIGVVLGATHVEDYPAQKQPEPAPENPRRKGK